MDALNHDILIRIFTTLSIQEILCLRQASRRLYLVSEQHAVWKTACTEEILNSGIPFSDRPLASFSAKDLEQQTLRAYKLGLNWGSPTTTLHHVSSSRGVGAIEKIRFISRHGQSWIVTTSIGIWWTLCIRDCDSCRVVAQWSPKKATFTGIAVNTDDQSDGAIAIAVQRDGYTTVEILAISNDDAHGMTVEPRKTLNMPSNPVALNGDFVALCDHDSETLILNWKTQERALLKSHTWQDRPLHVVFTHGSVLVVRARSTCIFDEPRMVLPSDDLTAILPRVSTSFGWVESVSLASRHPAPFGPVSSSQPPLLLLVRKKGNDPWRPTEEFQLMTLNTSSEHTSPHAPHNTSSIEHESVLFPFDLVSSLTSHHHGPLHCSDMVLGSCRTAVWVQPSDWAAAGLVVDDSVIDNTSVATSREALVVALFPGLLNRGSSEAQIKVVLENEGDYWSCLDYDEARGLIALGSSSGEVTVYRL